MGVFAAVVEEGGFSSAARALGLTRSAVSKQVALLEERLGAQLLRRTTRRIRLTEAGEVLYPRCRELLDIAKTATDELDALIDSPRGRLVVSAPLGIGEAFLAPRVPGFLARYPQIEIDVTLDDAVVDLVAGGIDVAIRAGRLADTSLVARRLRDLRLVICAAPTYLQDAAPIVVPADLEGHSWVSYSPLGLPQRLRLVRADRSADVRLGGRATTNNGAVLRSLLVAGQGVGVLPAFYVDADLAAGRLVPVLPGWQLPRAGIFAVFPPADPLAPKTRAFVDYLVETRATTRPA